MIGLVSVKPCCYWLWRLGSFRSVFCRQFNSDDPATRNGDANNHTSFCWTCTISPRNIKSTGTLRQVLRILQTTILVLILESWLTKLDQKPLEWQPTGTVNWGEGKATPFPFPSLFFCPKRTESLFTGSALLIDISLIIRTLHFPAYIAPVSYTHLTLPTKRIV